MHKSQRDHMSLTIDIYLRKGRHYDVLDFGSRTGGGDAKTHTGLLTGYDVTVIGVDVQPGPNVDLLMTKPYRIPVKSNSQDVVITGSTFEHIPFPWVSFMELCRVLKPGGLIFFTAPSRGHIHDSIDLWRYYPDSMRAFAAFGRVRLREAHTDMPPTREQSHRFDYGAIDTKNRYWGDTVAVFQKPQKYSRTAPLIREAMVLWANRIGGIDDVARPKRRRRRLELSRQR